MSEKTELKVEEKAVAKLDKKANRFSINCEVENTAILLFVTANKKILKCSDANFGKKEIVINEKTVDIILRSGEAEELIKENEFILWINGNKGYEKIAVGKVK
jgi:hypothetical protein